MIETTLTEALKSAYNRGAKDALESCQGAFEIACAAAIEKAVQAEREACAREAEALWQQFQDTKDAHERMSPEPFMPGRFGFDQSTVQQSHRIAAAIRARGQA